MVFSFFSYSTVLLSGIGTEILQATGAIRVDWLTKSCLCSVKDVSLKTGNLVCWYQFVTEKEIPWFVVHTD